MANQITVNSGSGNITVTTSRAVIGTVANVASANYANFAGEVVDPSQPNITSVGNLTSLNVVGTTTTGNLVVTGNLSVGNLVANSANYANFAGTAFAVAGANVSGAVANATFATTAGSANTANSATVANSANSVAGANVTGTVANATFATTAGSANTATVANSANSVTLANVSGAGNIASINLDGSASNVLYGNGAFAPAATGNVANANYANFAGTAFSVSGSNVSGAVANATYAANAGFATTAGSANTANSATVAASANSVTLANVSGAGNIASINLDGSSSNVLYGNGIFAPAATGNVANANYANFAGNAFSVDGGNVVGAVANATFALDAGNANIANIAYSVDGGNVSGTVANATFALDAGNANIANIAYSVDAANVSGLGNIATINLDGNASNFLDGTGNFVAAPSGANANYANFAGDVVNSAQPNITSVGTLTALAANTSTPVTIESSNGNVSFRTVNNSNAAGRRLEFAYNNPTTNTAVVFGADEAGFGYYMSNTAPGNVGTGNIRSYWQFLTNGDFRHTVGGTGNITAKNLILANVFTGSVIGNVIAGNVTANAGTITANGAGFVGNAAGLTNIPGANVTGTVANANVAVVANSANSVTLANVSGAGNIASINLDGNASNFLDGTGNFVAAPSGANANYANFAGTVLTNAQPNITSVGNLVSLNINSGVANSTTIETNPNTIPFAGQNFYSITNMYGPGANAAGRSKDAKVLNNYNVSEDIRTEYYGSKNGGNARAAQISVRLDANIGNANSDPLIPGAIQMQVYTPFSNLANANSTTFSSFGVDGTGAFLLLNAPQPNPIFQVFGYGSGTGNTAGQIGMLYNRRSGNSDSRGGVVAGDYLGNMEWRGAATTTGAFTANSTRAKIAPRVDSSYAGPNTSSMPVGIEFIGGTGPAPFTHTMHSNGNVTFSNVVNATTFVGNIASTNVTGLGNIATINLDGNVSNVLAGDGTFIAAGGGGGGGSNIANGNSNVSISTSDGPITVSANSVANVAIFNDANIELNKVIRTPGSVSIGPSAGNASTISSRSDVSIGSSAGSGTKGGDPSVAVGFQTGTVNQSQGSVAMGFQTGQNQGDAALAIGYGAGQSQGPFTIALGLFAGQTNQATSAISVGNQAGFTNQGTRGVAIGETSGQTGQGAESIAIGGSAGQTSQGTNSIAIGRLAGQTSQASNSIILNATGSALDQTTANTFNVKPVREINNLGSAVLDYDPTSGEISYHLRTFGSFTSNATQTSNGANTTNYVTFNNTEDANGISIVSSTQVTVARPGRYNIQFSAQVEKTDSGSDIIEIWLDKNGSAVANSATQLTLAGNNAKAVAAWDFNVNAANVNDYFRLAWASPDTDVQLTAIPSANTISGVAVPSVIFDINPIGA